MSNQINRRDFLVRTAALGAVTTLSTSPLTALAKEEIPTPYDAQEIQKAYLQNVYKKTNVENITGIPLKVLGTIPHEISGSFFRNGPNPYYDNFERHHWFDGDGMVHKISIHNGQATYQNRFIKTVGLDLERKAGKKEFIGMREYTRLGHFLGSLDRIFPLHGTGTNLGKLIKKHRNFKLGHEVLKDTSNTDLIYFNGKIITLWWLSGKPYALDPQTLETKEIETFSGTYAGDMNAHARVDEKTGELFFLDFNQDPKDPYVSAHCIGANGIRRWSTKITLPYPRIFHDVVYTERFVIVPNFPLGYLKNPATGVIEPQFDKSLPSELIVLNRQTGEKVKIFKTDPTYVLHFMNAFEDERGNIRMILTKFLDPINSPQNCSETIPSVGFLRVETNTVQWDLDFSSNTKPKETVLNDVNAEFPRINDAFLGQNYRYNYIPTLVPQREVEFDGFLKHDLQRGTFTKISYGKNLIGEEVTFIPRHNSVSEDDGYLSTIVHDKTKLGSNEFRIYDAKTLTWVCSIQIPVRVPAGFHTKWVENV